jgi:hypothetical protein
VTAGFAGPGPMWKRWDRWVEEFTHDLDNGLIV